jgi:hypothetical protein
MRAMPQKSQARARRDRGRRGIDAKTNKNDGSPVNDARPKRGRREDTNDEVGQPSPWTRRTLTLSVVEPLHGSPAHSTSMDRKPSAGGRFGPAKAQAGSITLVGAGYPTIAYGASPAAGSAGSSSCRRWCTTPRTSSPTRTCGPRARPVGILAVGLVVATAAAVRGVAVAPQVGVGVAALIGAVVPTDTVAATSAFGKLRVVGARNHAQ